MTPVAVPLQGSPHASGEQTAYGLATESVDPGYYRLDLSGPWSCLVLVRDGLVSVTPNKRIKLARQSVAARRSRGARSLSAVRWS